MIEVTLYKDSEPFSYRETWHDERPEWAGACREEEQVHRGWHGRLLSPFRSRWRSHPPTKETAMLAVIGLDIAKRFFQLHSVDPETGEITKLKLKRAERGRTSPIGSVVLLRWRRAGAPIIGHASCAHLVTRCDSLRRSLSSRSSRATRTMRPMLGRYGRQRRGPKCASCQSRPRPSRRSWRCTPCGTAWSRPGLPSYTVSVQSTHLDWPHPAHLDCSCAPM